VSEPSDPARLARVARLLTVARRIADPADPLGQRARTVLPTATGLSAEGVELALTRCLETGPTDLELRTLCEGVAPAPRAHVLLSSNVFVAAHRAIAIALAASPHVEVRASRREPEMTKLLHAGDPYLFRVVEDLAAGPGDHVWAYGTDATLTALRDELVSGVVLHPHGPGIGVTVLQPASGSEAGAVHELRAAARALAQDVIPFDQRGCLSPRVCCVVASVAATREFAVALAKELSQSEYAVPRGALDADEAADVAWYRDTWLYAAELLPAGKGWVGLEAEGERLLVPPPGRNLHVMRTPEPARALRPLAPSVAAVGYLGPVELRDSLRALLPRARLSGLGAMQRPRFDGPVDRRPGRAGTVL
jgi:hypothetical protein